jgi:hypothetical protein
MLQYFPRVVLLTALLTVALTPKVAPAVIGGDPGDLIYGPFSLNFESDRPELVITSTGVIFAGFARYIIGAGDDFIILRSEDHGRSWTEWSTLSDPGGDDVLYPMLRIASGSGSELLLVSYLQRGLTDDIWVASTSANDPNSNWNRVLVDSLPGGASVFPLAEKPVLATRPSATGDATVGVAYLVATAFYDYELHYAVSHDNGGTFQPEVLVVNQAGPIAGALRLKVALGFGDAGAAYLAVQRTNFGLVVNNTKIDILTAINDGETPTDWTIPGAQIVNLDTDELIYLGLASAPLGEEIVVGYQIGFSGDTEIYLHGSLDGGASWAPGSFADSSAYERFDLSWTPSGPMVTAFRDQYYHQLRAVGSVLGPYEAEPILRINSSAQDPGRLALDPSQGDQAAIIAAMSLEAGQENKLWFNAAWRDEPGYAVAQQDWLVELDDSDDSYVGAPGVADLNGDGLMEIVVATSYNLLLSYNSAGAGPVNFYAMGAAGSVTVPVISDLDGDDVPEVVVSGPDGRLHILDHELAPVTNTPVDLGTASDVFVSAGPVTGFVAAEIVAVSGDEVHLLDITGGEPSGWPRTFSAGGTVVGRAAIGDVDADGDNEVVVAFANGVLILGPNATVEAFFPAPAAGPSAGVALVDINGDGDLEVAIPMTDGTVELIHHDGSSVGPGWPYDTGTGSSVLGVSAARVLDASGGNICFSIAAGGVFAVDAFGTDLVGYPVMVATGETISSEPVVARVARPGSERPQLLVSTHEGWLHEWRAQGETPADWPNHYDLFPALSPVAADVDSDGIEEIVLVVGHKIYVFDTGTETLSDKHRRWAMAGHDLARTGCADCQPDVVSAVPESSPVGQTRISFAGAYPNPMPGRTAFSFALPAAGVAELAVYDLRGRRVRSFGQRDLEQGQHQVTWDGRDERGATVASGVYLARLVVGRGSRREVLTRSVVLQR